MLRGRAMNKNIINKNPRPFGLQFLEIPANQLAQADGATRKQHPVITQGISEPTTPCGRPDYF
jgi:hypothetical protein